MRVQVDYPRIVQSVAMSKWPNQNGIIFTLPDQTSGYKDRMRINATNPKTGETSYLEMQVPMESIDNIIDALTQIKNEYEKRMANPV